MRRTHTLPIQITPMGNQSIDLQLLQCTCYIRYQTEFILVHLCFGKQQVSEVCEVCNKTNAEWKDTQ